MWEYAIETAHDTSGRIHAGRKRGNIRPFWRKISISCSTTLITSRRSRGPHSRARPRRCVFSDASPSPRPSPQPPPAPSARARLEVVSRDLRRSFDTLDRPPAPMSFALGSSAAIAPTRVRAHRAPAGPAVARALPCARARRLRPKDASEPPSRREVLAAPARRPDRPALAPGSASAKSPRARAGRRRPPGIPGVKPVSRYDEWTTDPSAFGPPAAPRRLGRARTTRSSSP